MEVTGNIGSSRNSGDSGKHELVRIQKRGEFYLCICSDIIPNKGSFLNYLEDAITILPSVVVKKWLGLTVVVDIW
ncbi:hypothetical protein MKW98_009462 [Papaver atlanticum]|uniref:Uncharacterized protein n=1 Tax=Papaver atlanticum TaxID=357466 RepID=A0AAD4XDC6_9MAGN|nr:hypothetical protein MKW98_009462 [Papaver atlanticum]